MRVWTRLLLVLAASAALIGAATAAEAQQKKRRAKPPPLGAAVVHVLDAEGQPVADAEVILVVERADGTTDRRLARTGVDGDATFVDVRADCRELRASVEVGDRTIDGQPRDCAKGLEAFVVVPPIAPAAEAAAPPADEEDPYPVTTPSEVAIDPYAEPIPAPPPEETPASTEPQPGDPREDPFEARLRIGLDVCAAWFYEPGEQQRGCGDTSPVGVAFGADIGFHFEPWFLVALEFGYRYFGSEVDFSSFLQAEAGATTGEGTTDDALEGTETGAETGTSGTGEGTTDPVQLTDARNHLITIGMQLRGGWMFDNWVLAVDAVPLGIFHQVIKSDDNETSLNEFYVRLGLNAAYRVGRASWIGVYLELFQPMPWVHSALFQPGIVSFGLLLGNRF